MAYDARVLEVVIASPSDVQRERLIVREEIARWNVIFSRSQSLVLLPTGWDTHSAPELGDRPQQLINDHILEHADILVGIFWTRVGSPTGKALSGSIEEIERHLASGRHVMLYFSSAPVMPDSIDPEQYSKLNEFKQWARNQGIVDTYESLEEFRGKFSSHIPIALQTNKYLKSSLEKKTGSSAFADQADQGRTDPKALSDDERELLREATGEGGGLVVVARHYGGTRVEARERGFADENDPRSVARWVAAVEALVYRGMLKDISSKGEVFEVTHLGYTTADSI